MNINSLAENLKDIPQAKLVQYVQDPNSVVPQFLALAEIQRRKSLERSAGIAAPQTTVAQDIMAQANPVASQQPQGGIAGLPPQAPAQGVPSLPSGMNQQSFAGGGIVAFAGDKGSEVYDPNEISAPELSGLDKRIWEKIKNQFSEWNQPWRAPVNATPEQIRGAMTGKNVRGSQIEDEYVRGTVNPAQATYSANAPQIDDLSNGPTAAERAAFYEKKPSQAAAPGAPGPSKRASTKATSEETTTTPTSPKQDMYSKYEEMLKGQATEAKAGREQDKWMSLVEAGLGMMGGTSPYAAANIGQGAMGAMKGYAQDVAAGRKEERENIKDLMGLGMKREEAEMEARNLAMQEKYYGAVGEKDLAMADYYKNRGAAAGAAGAAGAGGIKDKDFISAVNRTYNTDVTAAKSQIGRELNDSELVRIYAGAEAKVRNALGMGGNQEGGNITPAAPTISWNSLGKK